MIKFIVKKFPYLKLNLLQAGIDLSPEDFIKKILINTLIVSITLTIVLILIFLRVNINLIFALIVFPIIFLLMFLFMIKTPKFKANKKVREIDREIIYAGRFLLIELSAGVPLYDAIKNATHSYKKIGKHFQDIIDRVEVGKPIEQALNDVSEITPSPDFRKLLAQISTALKTGADVSLALENIVDQITREHLIMVKEYGRKLNPLVMFYLLIAIVIPSLGIAILSLLGSFTELTLSLGNLIGIAVMIGILQLSFLSVILIQRPGVR